MLAITIAQLNQHRLATADSKFPQVHNGFCVETERNSRFNLFKNSKIKMRWSSSYLASLTEYNDLHFFVGTHRHVLLISKSPCSIMCVWKPLPLMRLTGVSYSDLYRTLFGVRVASANCSKRGIAANIIQIK